MNSLSSARSTVPGPAGGARILIADDVLSHRELMRYALESSGYEVIEAEDGEQAVERATGFAPHIVILDLNMPKMNGCAAAMALRGIPAFTATPIIALTANTSDQSPEEITLAGFNHYLVKPVGPARLRKCISDLL